MPRSTSNYGLNRLANILIFLATMCGGGGITASTATCGVSKRQPCYIEVARVGEALHPGPVHGFDDDDPSSSDHDDGQPLPGEWDWEPGQSDNEYDDLEPPASLPMPSSPPTAVEEWLAKHAGKPFVAVGGSVTVKPKFQGEQPG